MTHGPQRGYILVPAIFMLALLALLGWLINADSSSNLNLGKQQAVAQTARYVAAAGIVHAQAQANYKTCVAYNLADTAFHTGSYSATFEPNSGSPVNIFASAVLTDGSTASMQRLNVPIFDEANINSLNLQPGSGGKDTYLHEGVNRNANYGSANYLELDNDGAERIILLSFDLASLPANAKIKSATLALYLEASAGASITDGVIAVHQVTRSWFEGVDNGAKPPSAPGATYNKYDGSSLLFGYWATPGGDYDPTPAASTTIASHNRGWYQWNVTALAEGGAQSALANDGVLLRAASGVVKAIRFTSSDSANANVRPRLTINYTCECGTSCASIPAPKCEADYTPMVKAKEFSSGTMGASDVQGVVYLPEGALFNGATAPAGGAWILIDPFDELFYMTNMDGALISSLAIPVDNVTGGVYVSSGNHFDQLALTTTTGSLVYMDMAGNIGTTLSTGDFGVSQPAGIGFVGEGASSNYKDHLLVLDSASEVVSVIDQAGAVATTVNVNDGGPALAEDVQHLPGGDKLLVTYDCCKHAIYNFYGTKLRDYPLAGFGAARPKASAIHPLSCEHLVFDDNSDKLMSLQGNGASPYKESFQTWSATQTGTWEEKDLTPFGVPPNAVVEVAVANAENIRRWGGVRAFSSSLERRVQLRAAQNGQDFIVMHVQADAAGRIEHYSANTATLTFVLLGYWTTGSYVETWDSFTAGGSNEWRNLSLSDYGVGSGQVAEIVMTNKNSAISRVAGVRSDDSTRQRRIALHQSETDAVDTSTLLVNTSADSNARIEIFADSTTDVDFYLAGYWSVPPGSYMEAAGDNAAAPAGAVWQSVDLNAIAAVPAGTVASLLLANTSSSTAKPMGTRETGSALQRKLVVQSADGADSAGLHANIDSNASAQWFSESSSDHIFSISGWWEFD